MNRKNITCAMTLMLHFAILLPMGAKAGIEKYDPGFSGWTAGPAYGGVSATMEEAAAKFCATAGATLNHIVPNYGGSCFAAVVCNQSYLPALNTYIEAETTIGKVLNACAPSWRASDCLCIRSTPSLTLSVTPSQPAVVPGFSGVKNGKVLTSSILALTLQQNGQSAGSRTLTLQSTRGSLDAFAPSVTITTDVNGKATTMISTRNQPGTSTVSAADSAIQTTVPGQVNWLPAKYDTEFLVTCYTIADEASAPAKPTQADVCGLPKKQSYRKEFLDDVRMQGSGKALDGAILHYSGNGCYNQDVCARTATGACATVGTTIAVDPNVIPKRSTVAVNVLGARKAQDTGGRITGYHIDDYMGSQPAQCRLLGRRHSSVTFTNY